MGELWFYIKGCLGLLKDEDVCEFSKKYFDVHDYHAYKGGDGKPCHFYTYTCHMCGEKFTI